MSDRDTLVGLEWNCRLLLLNPITLHAPKIESKNINHYVRRVNELHVHLHVHVPVLYFIILIIYIYSKLVLVKKTQLGLPMHAFTYL